MYVDSHIHLYSDEYIGILDNVIEDARRGKVKAILCVSEDYDSSLKSLELASKYDVVYAAIGVHPWTASHNIDDLDKVVNLAYEKRADVVGIGEVGLDKTYVKSEKAWDDQLKTFARMVEVSLELNKPLNIHSRGTARDVLEILRFYNVKKAHFHWFSDSEDVLKDVVCEGYYVSFTPSITYSKRVQKLARIVPPEQVLTESDGPVPFFGELKGKLVMPKHVQLVVNKLSEIYEIDAEKLMRIIWGNFKKLYKVEGDDDFSG